MPYVSKIFFTHAGRGAGSLIGGFLISSIGLVWTFRVFGITSFIFAFVYLFLQKKVLNKKVDEGTQLNLLFKITQPFFKSIQSTINYTNRVQVTHFLIKNEYFLVPAADVKEEEAESLKASEIA